MAWIDDYLRKQFDRIRPIEHEIKLPMATKEDWEEARKEGGDGNES